MYKYAFSCNKIFNFDKNGRIFAKSLQLAKIDCTPFKSNFYKKLDLSFSIRNPTHNQIGPPKLNDILITFLASYNQTFWITIHPEGAVVWGQQ